MPETKRIYMCLVYARRGDRRHSRLNPHISGQESAKKIVNTGNQNNLLNHRSKIQNSHKMQLTR